MKVIVLSYFPNLTSDQVPDLLEATPFLKVIQEPLFEMTLELEEDSELSPLSMYELFQNDVDPSAIMVMIPLDTLWLEKSWIYDQIALLKGQFYTLETFLYHVMLKKPDIKPLIKSKLESLLEEEYIDSCVAYASYAMNASLTSKNLYIHRNTLQYRFKVIYEKTGLNPKDFETIALFHACFL